VVSRKDLSGDGVSPFEPEGSLGGSTTSRSGSLQVDKRDGLTVYLRVDYKIVLLVVVVFDLIHSSLNEIVSNVFGS